MINFDIKNSYYQQDLAAVASLNFIPWQQLENKSVLLTGATGLIGSFLVDALMYRNEHYGSHTAVYALSRNAAAAAQRFISYKNSSLFYYIQQDVTEKFGLESKIDFLIHNAGNAYPASFVADPVGTMKSNLWGIASLMDYAVKVKSERVLYVSSGEVYGEGNGADFDESYSGYVNGLHFRSCYPQGKRAAETLCIAYSEQYAADVVIARPCHIYGATFTETDNRAFAQFARSLLAKKEVVLKSVGEQLRSYCYVADCAAAMLTILLRGQAGQAYNIANKRSNTTIADLAKTMAAAGGGQVVFDLPTEVEKKGYSAVSRAVLNAEKLEILGWKAMYSLQDGVLQAMKILTSINQK
jgi:nucleoside-diphosphate-sugar epimerase